MAGQEFSSPDRADPVSFDRAPRRGLQGKEPGPAKTVRDRKADRTGPWLRPNQQRKRDEKRSAYRRSEGSGLVF
jgi:hypothetical protein